MTHWRKDRRIEIQMKWGKVWRWIRYKFWPAFQALLMLALLCWATFGLMNYISETGQAKSKCLAAGYSDIEKTRSGYYCVGIRDGNTVTVRTEDLGE